MAHLSERFLLLKISITELHLGFAQNKAKHSEVRSNKTPRWLVQFVLLHVCGTNRPSVRMDGAESSASWHEEFMMLPKNSLGRVRLAAKGSDVTSYMMGLVWRWPLTPNYAVLDPVSKGKRLEKEDGEWTIQWCHCDVHLGLFKMCFWLKQVTDITTVKNVWHDCW